MYNELESYHDPKQLKYSYYLELRLFSTYLLNNQLFDLFLQSLMIEICNFEIYIYLNIT
jgi:hypothetical protein